MRKKPESSGGTHPAIGFLRNRRPGSQLRQKFPHIGHQEECVKSAKLNGIRVNQVSEIKQKDELYLAEKPAYTGLSRENSRLNSKRHIYLA